MTSAAAVHRRANPTEETVTAGTTRIGAVSGDPSQGYSAFDEDGRLLEVYTTMQAARRRVFDHHRGEDLR